MSNIKVGDMVSIGLFKGKVIELFTWEGQMWAMVSMVGHSAAYKVSELRRIDE